MTRVPCRNCGVLNNTSDMGYCWKCKASLVQAPGSAATEMREMATGVITYVEGGKEHKWSIGCMAWETAEHLRKHLAVWKPQARFVSGEIRSDKRQNNALVTSRETEPLHAEKH